MVMDVKISQMPLAESLNGDELIPIVQNGTNKTTTVSDIKGDVITQEELTNALAGKVDKEGSKVLSDENFTTKLKSKLDGIAERANNYTHPNTHPASIIVEDDTHKFVTSKEKIKLDSLENYDDTDIKSSLAGKVDKVEGKELSTNDYTDAEKKKLNDIKPITTGSFNNAPNEVSLILKRYGTGLAPLSMTLAPATSEKAGVMRNIDKAKLDSIEESANNYTHPTTAGNKHIPAGGTLGQILVNNGDGTAKWEDAPSYTGYEDIYSYGVEWDTTVADPTLTRIGNPLLHKSLPVQSQYRGCVANGSMINYYLNPNDWSKKITGEASILDGTDGSVRVHIPKFYGKSGISGVKKWVRMSTVKIDNTWIEIPEMLVDAYRCTVNQTGNKAVSVVNTTAQFRGGGNRTANDTYLSIDAFRSDLGKPRTNTTRANMRTYAANAGSELLCYEYYKWIFYWAWVIEYATLNSQAAYNAELTAEGYHQGGLGDGVTTWNWDIWTSYNGNYPITPCGYCNEFGNFTGVKALVIPETVVNESTTVATKTFKVPRWRGFDNPFGDIWTNLDGIIIERTTANQPSNVYTTIDTSAFGDDNVAKGKMSVTGIEIASDGYTTDFDLGETGEIIPSKVGGSTTTYMCDYHYCNASSTALRTLFVGGRAHYGGSAGLGCFHSNDGVGDSGAAVGFRTINKI